MRNGAVGSSMPPLTWARTAGCGAIYLHSRVISSAASRYSSKVTFPPMFYDTIRFTTSGTTIRKSSHSSPFTIKKPSSGPRRFYKTSMKLWKSGITFPDAAMDSGLLGPVTLLVHLNRPRIGARSSTVCGGHCARSVKIAPSNARWAGLVGVSGMLAITLRMMFFARALFA